MSLDLNQQHCPHDREVPLSINFISFYSACTYVCLPPECLVTEEAKLELRSPKPKLQIVVSHYECWEANSGPLKE